MVIFSLLMHLQKYLTNPMDEHHKQFYRLMPRTPLLKTKTQQAKHLTYQQQLDEHTFSVK